MTPRSESDARGCILSLGPGLAFLFLLEGTLLACFCYIGLTDRSPGVTDTMRLWAALGIATAVGLLLEGLMFRIFLTAGSRWSWYGALMMSLIGFGGSLGLCWVGYLWVVEVA